MMGPLAHGRGAATAIVSKRIFRLSANRCRPIRSYRFFGILHGDPLEPAEMMFALRRYLRPGKFEKTGKRILSDSDS